MGTRFIFSNFGNLPILAKTLWNVPKYVLDISQQQTYNKIVGIYRPDFKVVCCFHHKTDSAESTFYIKSDLIFWCDKYRMEELCTFSRVNMTTTFEIMYSFEEKNNEEEYFYSRNIDTFSTKLNINMQNIKTHIDEILIMNKNKCVVS
jgi:hypothetical protein